MQRQEIASDLEAIIGNRGLQHVIAGLPDLAPTGVSRLRAQPGGNRDVLRQALPGARARRGRDKYASLATRLRLWIHSMSRGLYEGQIVARLARLTPAEVTRVERAYGQPAGVGGAWDPYLLRADVAANLPNGKRIAKWIEQHSELPPRATPEQAERALQKETKERAARAWPADMRKRTLDLLREPAKWPARVKGPEGDVILGGQAWIAKQVQFWGPWVIKNFDYLFAAREITESDVAWLSKGHGGLVLIWQVRTRVWNRWLQINKESAQPTMFHRPTDVLGERRGTIVAARTALPKLREFRTLFVKTSGPLADYMKEMVDTRIAQLEQVIKENQ